MRQRGRLMTTILAAATIAAVLVLGTGAGLQAGAARKLEIFSWWTAGGEADGLNAMFEIYKKRFPGVEIINATVAGGAGTNAKAVLKTRMTGGDPPDSFQVHGGEELTSTWVTTGFMESLAALYQSEGWTRVFPKDLIDIVSFRGQPYSVPVNVHRGNVLWYNKKIFDQNNLKVPTTWFEFYQVADALKAKGITPLALGDKNKWEAAHLFEDVLLATNKADGYRG
ncbi:MAG: ABC transporter substrate-binding protein, partial [bacterium]